MPHLSPNCMEKSDNLITGSKTREPVRTCAIICGLARYGEEEAANEANLISSMRQPIKQVVTEMNYRTFISGMNRGIEQLGAELVLEFKEQYNLTLWGIISSEEQWIGWTGKERDRFFRLMEMADYEFRTSNKESEKSRASQLKVIEEEADVLIVITASLSEEIRGILISAVTKGKKVFLINHETAEISSFLKLI